MNLKSRKIILETLKPYVIKQVLVILIIILATVFSLLNPYIMKKIIDIAIPGRNFEYLIKCISIYLAVYIASQLLMILQNFITTWLGQKMLYDVRMTLYQNIISKQLCFFKKMETGEIIARVLNESPNVVSLLIGTPITVIKEVITFVATFIIMFIINQKLTLMFLIITPFMYIILKYFNPKIRKIDTEGMSFYATINNNLQEIISNIKILKYTGEYQYHKKRFSNSLHNRMGNEFKSFKLNAIANILLSFVYFLPHIILLGYGGYLIMNDQLSIGSLVALSAYLGNIFTPIRNLTNMNFKLQQNIASFTRYKNLLESYTLENNGENKVKINKMKKGVHMDSVWYAYDESTYLIKNFSCSIPIGTKVRILGSNGIGKTTLIDLIVGLLTPKRGCVTYDSVDTRNIDMQNLKNNIGIISQNSTVFTDSIRTNITLGRDIQDSEIERLARKLKFLDIIEGDRLNLDTIVSSSNLDLSGGQRQKIAILRAFIGDPQMLIFDEIETYLDSFTIKNLIAFINGLSKEKIIIYITHRDNLQIKYDKTVDLDQMQFESLEQVKEIT